MSATPCRPTSLPDTGLKATPGLRMKVGDDPHRGIDRVRRVAKEVRAGDIPVADANTSRKKHEAMSVAAAVGDQTRERAACRP